MAVPSELAQHIESYVDTSRSPTQQATSLDAVISLVKNHLITIETLVREMEIYLTTTDNVIRARELLMNLVSKPLDNVTMHSLIGFFTDRLADWRALRGALVGCLALLRRKSNNGTVTASDAKAVAESYLRNIQVQSLGQHDRKLCYELLECLIERYPNEVASLGENLIYGICEAVDGEKDPYCLLRAFHIIEALVQLFPDPSGPLASYCGDISENLGLYFPIHFTHPNGEEADVKRDDLSRALMLAFASTPLFEPFTVPLFLEKLSSPLPLAKVDSLKYLSYCAPNYGADRMAKHAGAIWISLKNAISTSMLESAKSFTSQSLNGLGFEENEITTEAFMLLKTVLMQNSDLLSSLIMDDEDISTTFNNMTSYGSYSDIPLQGKQRLHVVGRILYITTKTNIACCNRFFESFFPRLMDILEISKRNSSGGCFLDENYSLANKFHFGAVYLCVELLSAYRDLIMESRVTATDSIHAKEACCCMLQRFSLSLINAFCSTLRTGCNKVSDDVDIYFRVKGLQILATFPEDLLPISGSIFENILRTFMSIILVDFNHILLWKLALRALVHIGTFIDTCSRSEKASSFMAIVVEKILSLVPFDESTLPFSLKLEAIFEIGTSRQSHMLKIIRGLEESVFASLSDVYVHGNLRSVDMAIQLLECFSNKIFPWIHGTGDLEEVLLRFAINVWNHVKSWTASDVQVQEKGLLDATMMATKLAVGSCSEESQNIIIQKAYSVLSSNTSLIVKESTTTSIPVHPEGLQLTRQTDKFSHKDECILLLFASIIIAARPKTHIPNVREILHLFIASFLKGYVSSAQALGSMINKLGLKSNGTEISSDCALEEAIYIIFNTKPWNSYNNSVSGQCEATSNGIEIGLSDLCVGYVNNRLLQVNAIVGLAWIGKGLLLRGHEKVKDVTMILLQCLLSDGSTGASKLKQSLLEKTCEQDLHPSVMKSAADAFHILMSDSDDCLNQKFHAIIRPLYKQRFFSTVMPILLSLVVKSDSSFSRYMLYRASALVILDAPLIVVVSEAKKITPILLEGLSVLSEDIVDKEKLYALLLVLSGILTDKNGQEAIMENAHIIINRLTDLISYPHKMLVRETAIQCLVPMSKLPYTMIYPMRTQVLQAISKALDDPRRAVRQEAVRCRQAWASIASRSPHF
ncbi:MMS19 nucleotide excision repair protein homolog isoform X2 [Ziziphus jujuba]|uniref:MMS19 nucleotide excision repair protein n=1 Tax=Ziziphus jujuba TaxID=326968 RepID=A0ABM3IGQ5_ZIZJJ|nr:MMS19 nucleotide excision repair protein homolog isoform X2 [Ziziphus jujuba]